MTLISLILTYLLGYLVGAIPFSFIIAKLKGVDLRKVGSGNIGATNVLRSCGKVAGFWAYFADIAKGVAAPLLIDLLRRALGPNGEESEWLKILFLFSYFTPIVGHLFPVFLGFKGGKGVATSAGVLLYLVPVPLLATIAIFFAVFLPTRIISISSIVAALVFPPIVALHHVLSQKDWLWEWAAFVAPSVSAEIGVFLGIASFLSLFIIYRHRENIRRLLRGEEHSFKKKKVAKASRKSGKKLLRKKSAKSSGKRR
ncbi:MAG: glycerol-3-phosphate 1-O-acyltransferase PlsY [Spirochaetia bacterium]|nr:glycerol-3-phosphate 1-O-acyltransferase PlsY [Spirochaetia bacterium]